MPKYYQYLLDVIFECWNKESERRPSVKQVGEMIMDASKSLDTLNLNKFLEQTKIFKNQSYKKYNCGTLENVKNACLKFGFANMRRVIKSVFEDDITFDTESIEDCFINNITHP